MKKFLIISAIAAIAAAVAPSAKVEAQERPAVERVILKDTLVNVDTITTALTFNAVASNVVALQITGVSNSGTISATLTVEGSVDGIGWITIDTMSLSSTWLKKKIDITRTSFYNYRCRGTAPGTQNSYVYFSLLRRRDEDR